jgi:hypothetical protein
MDTWIWIVIAAAANFVLVALTVMRNTGTRRLDKKRAEAGEPRQEAQQPTGTAGQQDAGAKQEAERARREREAAEGALWRAADVNRTRDEFKNAPEFHKAAGRDDSYSARSALTTGDRQAA